jgi:hypothetical protein
MANSHESKLDAVLKAIEALTTRTRALKTWPQELVQVQEPKFLN